MAMTLRLDDDLAERLRARAERDKTSMQALVSTAVEQFLARDAKRAALAGAMAEIKAEYGDVLRRLGE